MVFDTRLPRGGGRGEDEEIAFPPSHAFCFAVRPGFQEWSQRHSETPTSYNIKEADYLAKQQSQIILPSQQTHFACLPPPPRLCPTPQHERTFLKMAFKYTCTDCPNRTTYYDFNDLRVHLHSCGHRQYFEH